MKQVGDKTAMEESVMVEGGEFCLDHSKEIIKVMSSRSREAALSFAKKYDGNGYMIIFEEAGGHQRIVK